VCSVEIARCPEEDNRMKASTLSSSRISPIITMLYAQSEQRKRTEVYKSRVNERAGKTTTFLNRHEIQLHGTSDKIWTMMMHCRGRFLHLFTPIAFCARENDSFSSKRCFATCSFAKDEAKTAG
jgi:hypothetical protein